jgi:hypothetical protein
MTLAWSGLMFIGAKGNTVREIVDRCIGMSWVTK